MQKGMAHIKIRTTSLLLIRISYHWVLVCLVCEEFFDLCNQLKFVTWEVMEIQFLFHVFFTSQAVFKEQMKFVIRGITALQ
jgi:hypothetical protein